jgi:hypothetical protein
MQRGELSPYSTRSLAQDRHREPQSGVAIQSFAGLLYFVRNDD